MTLDEFRQELTALGPDEGYDCDDPRVAKLVDELIAEGFAEPFWCPTVGKTLIRRKDSRAEDADLTLIDAIMKRHGWTKVERQFLRTIATRER